MGKIDVEGLCKAKAGTVCTCGPCKHAIRIAAARAGVSVTTVLAQLGASKPASGSPAAPLRTRTLGTVAERMSVGTREGLLQGSEGILEMLRMLG